MDDLEVLHIRGSETAVALAVALRPYKIRECVRPETDKRGALTEYLGYLSYTVVQFSGLYSLYGMMYGISRVMSCVDGIYEQFSEMLRIQFAVEIVQRILLDSVQEHLIVQVRGK